MPSTNAAELMQAREDRHRELLQRYRELVRKYQHSVDHHAHSATLADWLLQNSQDGVVLISGKKLLASNRRFHHLCAAHRDWQPEGDPTAAAPETLLSAACRAAEVEERSDEGELLRVRPVGLTAPTLEVSVHRVDRQGSGDTRVVVLQDVSRREEWRRDQDESGVRDQFLGTLAHELRNPLASITNAAELMRASADPKVRRAAEIIARQARLQARMVEDLLDVTRVREGKLRLQRERVDLRRAVEAAVEATEPLWKHGPRLEVSTGDQPIWVDGDLTRLVQIVTNLLGNAAKFTPPGRKCGLELSREPDIAWLRVWDTGKGIAPELLPRLWEPFFQERDAHGGSARAGLGIGLALVRTLVELHGGGVRATSEGPERGAEFTIWLPCCPAPSADRQPPPRRAARSLRVLIVEGDREAREALTELLAMQGHHAAAAATAYDAIGLALRDRPEVVLSDLHLSDKDGYAVATALRPLLPDARLIAMSPYLNAEAEERVVAAGFDQWLEKPVDPRRLQTALDSPPRHAPTA
ncbi:MAG: sensor hybrid histidine kinase [Armatimonadetes bacterium]|jgi:signal transduction histidine kinase/CheY-like chemotaxis protein|nr:sensor hybrid histidine kinase [Armatimonadota bacterium]